MWRSSPRKSRRGVLKLARQAEQGQRDDFPNELIRSALNLLRIVSSETNKIIVACSFGKDSLTTLDLCSQVFTEVIAFYLYRVAGMQVIEKWRRFVKKRWGIDVIMLPHFDLSRIYRNAVLMPHWEGLENTPSVSFREIEDYLRLKTGIKWIAYGWRRSDSINRAVILKRAMGLDYENCRVFPIYRWSRKNVYAYLSLRKIPIPPKLGREEQNGFDFHPGALSYLKENYPRDWKKWLKNFPFSEVMLKF